MRYKNIPICIDFDGTCTTHNFPEVGKDIGAQRVLKRLVDEGALLILFTMRSDGRKDGSNPLTEAVNWFKKNDIPLWGINRNPTQDEWTSSPKAYGHLFIDDAALGAPLVRPWQERPYIDWNAVEEMLFGEESETAIGKHAH